MKCSQHRQIEKGEPDHRGSHQAGFWLDGVGVRGEPAIKRRDTLVSEMEPGGLERSDRIMDATKMKASPEGWPKIFLPKQKLFLGSDCIFHGLGDAEFHHGLGRDLDGFAGLGITSHAGFPV